MKWPFSVDWRADYNPMQTAAYTPLTPNLTCTTAFGACLVNQRPGFVYNEIQADYHMAKFGYSFGVAEVKEDPLTLTMPVLSPSSNQIHGGFSLGNQTRHGWNAGMNWFYDIKQGLLDTVMAQATYNTDCCGFSAEYRLFDFGTRHESQFLGAIRIANLGSGGTLARQQNIF